MYDIVDLKSEYTRYLKICRYVLSGCNWKITRFFWSAVDCTRNVCHIIFIPTETQTTVCNATAIVDLIVSNVIFLYLFCRFHLLNIFGIKRKLEIRSTQLRPGLVGELPFGVMSASFFFYFNWFCSRFYGYFFMEYWVKSRNAICRSDF